MSDVATITTYHSEDAPENRRWLAFFLAGSDVLPMYFAGPTRESVIARAEEFRAEQLARKERGESYAAALSERMKRRRKAETEDAHNEL